MSAGHPVRGAGAPRHQAAGERRPRPPTAGLLLLRLRLRLARLRRLKAAWLFRPRTARERPQLPALLTLPPISRGRRQAVCPRREQPLGPVPPQGPVPPLGPGPPLGRGETAVTGTPAVRSRGRSPSPPDATARLTGARRPAPLLAAAAGAWSRRSALRYPTFDDVVRQAVLAATGPRSHPYPGLVGARELENAFASP